ncbi:type II secretion system F family protein [bacterium]|nr:type II secretion system F family protein [bacterium]
MTQYFCGVRDRQGARQSGVINASSAAEAMARLRERFPLVLRLDEVSGRGNFFSRLRLRRRVSSEDLLAFTHQLSSMLSAGLSFGAAMEILLLDRVHCAPMRQVIVDLAAQVSEGRSFSQSLRNHPQVFSEMYLSLVEAGESSANLPETLERLASYQEKAMRFKLELLSALVYPALVLIFGVLVAMAILAYGAPVLEQMYSAAGLRLPALSQFFVWLGLLLKKTSPGLMLGLALGCLLARRWMPGGSLTRLARNLLSRVGPVKSLLLEAAVARSCQTMATLYSGGVPVLKALELSAQAADHPELRQTFLRVRKEVASGSNLSAPLLASSVFPAMASGMITAGEAAGSLPAMLEHLAKFYETRLDFALRSFSRLVEPCLILLVGFLIGSIVLALGLPFMNLVAVLH